MHMSHCCSCDVVADTPTSNSDPTGQRNPFISFSGDLMAYCGNPIAMELWKDALGMAARVDSRPARFSKLAFQVGSRPVTDFVQFFGTTKKWAFFFTNESGAFIYA